ncbi:hypothetical protein LINPERPRIM_LOCUS38029 [Linum perenne]
MVADSGSSSPSPKAWTDLFDSGSDLSLRYIKPVLVNGALRIPQSVLNQGLARMKRCLLGQFLGPSPPIRVFQSVATRLWGRDGGVRISLQQNGLFLIQFPSAEDSSLDGLGYAKACVLVSKGAERPLVLNVAPDGFDLITIDLEYLPPRDYSRKTSAVVSKSKWKQKGVVGSSVDPPRAVEPIQVSTNKQPSSSEVVSEEPQQLSGSLVISEEPTANKVILESPTKQTSAGSSPNKGNTSVASDLRSSQVGGIALTGSQFGALALDDLEFLALHSSLPPVASKRVTRAQGGKGSIPPKPPHK